MITKKGLAMHTDELIALLSNNTQQPRQSYLRQVRLALFLTLLAAIVVVDFTVHLRGDLGNIFNDFMMFNKYGFTFGMLVASGIAWWRSGQPNRSIQGPLMFIALFLGWQFIMCVQSFFVRDFAVLQAAVMNIDGKLCSMIVLGLSIPITYVLVRLNRALAPLDFKTHGYVTALFASSIAMFAFSLHCSHDEPLYMAVWYVGAVVLSVLVYGRVAARKAVW